MPGIDRRAIWERDGGICGICKEPVAFEDMQLDHVLPRSFNGPDGSENLQPSHEPCNRRKGYGVPGYLTTKQAAARLGWTQNLLYSRILWNGVQVVKGRHGTNFFAEAEIERIERTGWRIPAGSVDAFIERRRASTGGGREEP
jgi:hypothetical protein